MRECFSWRPSFKSSTSSLNGKIEYDNTTWHVHVKCAYRCLCTMQWWQNKSCFIDLKTMKLFLPSAVLRSCVSFILYMKHKRSQILKRLFDQWKIYFHISAIMVNTVLKPFQPPTHYCSQKPNTRHNSYVRERVFGCLRWHFVIV
jgi:hypothetical protein